MFSKQNEKAEIKHSKTMNWLRSRGEKAQNAMLKWY